MTDNLTHHPDCEFWFDYTPRDCTCGHSQPRPAWSTLEPWTVEAMDEWRREVRAQFERSNPDAQ